MCDRIIALHLARGSVHEVQSFLATLRECDGDLGSRLSGKTMRAVEGAGLLGDETEEQ